MWRNLPVWILDMKAANTLPEVVVTPYVHNDYSLNHILVGVSIPVVEWYSRRSVAEDYGLALLNHTGEKGERSLIAYSKSNHCTLRWKTVTLRALLAVRDQLTSDVFDKVLTHQFGQEV